MGPSLSRRFRLALGAAGVALAAFAASDVAAKEATRYGIEGKFVAYDPQRQVFKVLVTSRSAGGFGGSTVGVEAPDDVTPNQEMEFAVSPEGSVLNRTVIKSQKGQGLDRSGTQEGFNKAVEAIPRDRSLALSISDNKAGATPKYRLQTVIIKLTQAEMEARLREILQDDEPGEDLTPGD
jgi:hypothetical protein